MYISNGCYVVHACMCVRLPCIYIMLTHVCACAAGGRVHDFTQNVTYLISLYLQNFATQLKDMASTLETSA